MMMRSLALSLVRGLIMPTAVRDIAAPVVTLAALTTIDATATLTGTVDDSTATVQILVGGLSYPAVVTGNTWAAAGVPLAIGSNAVAVQAADLAGNVGTASGSAYRFHPSLLFENGELGALYADDIAVPSLYQDANGTTPGASNAPVGLRLDASQAMRYGPELFDDAQTTLENGAERISPGRYAVARRDGMGLSRARICGVLRVGAVYEIRVRYLEYSGSASVNGSTNCGLSWGFNPVAVPAGQYLGYGEHVATSLAANPDLHISSTNLGYGLDVEVISVREVLGYHAGQYTASRRPMYRTAPARIDYDTVDDALVTTWPASLGSNCTVVRAIPGVGAQILTDQTIGTTYTDSTDNCGLIIVNRALTAAERAGVTQWAKKVGL